MTIVNPYAVDPRGRGLKVAQWLLDQRVDILITADDVREKGPGYALGDAGVTILISGYHCAFDCTGDPLRSAWPR